MHLGPEFAILAGSSPTLEHSPEPHVVRPCKPRNPPSWGPPWPGTACGEHCGKRRSTDLLSPPFDHSPRPDPRPLGKPSTTRRFSALHPQLSVLPPKAFDLTQLLSLAGLHFLRCRVLPNSKPPLLRLRILSLSRGGKPNRTARVENNSELTAPLTSRSQTNESTLRSRTTA